MGKRNELKQIVREIKRTYKEYIEKRNDEITSFVKLLSLFDIPLDEARLADYRIESISFEKPTIVVIDEGTNNIYNAEYRYHEDTTNLLNYTKNYIRVTINNTFFKIISFYRLPFVGHEERHIQTSIILINDEFELCFTKEGIIETGYTKDHLLPGFIIKYAKNLENELEELKHQILLTKVYKEYDKTFNGRAYNMIYNYSGNMIEIDGDEQVTHDIFSPCDILYFINKMRIKDENGQVKNSLVGFCFDNLMDYSFKNIPFTSCLDELNVRDKQELFDTNTKAAVYLKGGVPRERWCEFKIFKKNHQIEVSYCVKVKKQDSEKSSTDNCWNIFDYGVLFDNKQTVCADFLKLPVLTANEGFSIEEIDNIIETLNSRYEEDEFIRLVTIQLLAFRHKICINSGLENENDLLAPKKFAQMSIPDIVKDVIENKETYFALAEKQFQESANIDDPKNIKKLRRIQ